MGTRQNSINKDMVEAVGKLGNMFKGKQAKFSTRAKRIIAVSSLAAAGASDYGESVIFGTLKAITEEMKMGLTDKELASGCPDVGTLRNWEMNVAAGCMAKVISQIARDAEYMMENYKQKLQITLVTDHGNRSGVDHFVKMIVWTSVDKQGSFTSTKVVTQPSLWQMQFIDLSNHSISAVWTSNSHSSVVTLAAAPKCKSSIQHSYGYGCTLFNERFCQLHFTCI
eukprot:scaffold44959_cov39-Cyclotella_meneghiniana.AAC.6